MIFINILLLIPCVFNVKNFITTKNEGFAIFISRCVHNGKCAVYEFTEDIHKLTLSITITSF